MPPHPDLKEKFRKGQVDLPDAVKNPAVRRAKGIDQGADSGSLLAPKPAAPSGAWKALAILVQFPDKSATGSASFFDSLLFPSNASSYKTLRGYFNAVSHSKLDIQTDSQPSNAGWLMMPHPYSYYAAGNNGFGTYPQNAQGLAEDAINAAAAAKVDFSPYDNNRDGTVDTVVIVHAGPGAEWTGLKSDIWSHSWSLPTPLAVGSTKVSGYTMEPEYWKTSGDMTVGVYAHEFGHALGLPDLYDTDYSSDGAGQWSLMAGGSWNGVNGDSPAFLDASSRVKLGFVPATTISSSTGKSVAIGAAESSDTVYRLAPLVGGAREYFLVENRQKLGSDAALPAAGILVWHIDDAISSNDLEYSKATNSQCGARHYHVALEQADGRFQLETYNDGNSGDSGDVYVSGRQFTTTTGAKPNSSSYYSTKSTGVQVTGVSASGAAMTAKLYGK